MKRIATLLAARMGLLLLIPLAYAWQDWMTAAGITDAYEAVKAAFNSLRGR